MSWIVDGRQLTNAQYEELQRQERLEKQRAEEEASRLRRQLGAAFAALKEHLRQNPNGSQKITDEAALDQQIYQNPCANLERADEAPRCNAIKRDGTGCMSPKMNDHIYCYAHIQMMEARAEGLVLPPLEDANAIQMAIMLVQRALIDDEISEKKAGLLLYSIQIAAANVGKTTFGQAADEDMVMDMVDEKEAIEGNSHRRAKQERLDEIQRNKSLPLMNTDNTDRKTGEQTISLINTEDTDQEGKLGRMLPQAAKSGGVLEGFAS
jgi:hypothetical protein